MREAMEVVKRHRAEIAETIDGGQAHTGVTKPPTEAEAKIKWGGLVKANKFEEKVAEHNARLLQEEEEAKALKAIGQKNAKVFKKSSLSIVDNVKVLEVPSPNKTFPVKAPQNDSSQEETKTEVTPATPAVRSDPLPGTLRSRPSYRMHDRMTAMQDRIDETPKAVVKRQAAFKVGDRVEGLFAGHDWFLGRVVAMIDNDAQFVYDVLYDDGDSEQGVKENLIRKVPEMQVKFLFAVD
jgi:hypothetical protein